MAQLRSTTVAFVNVALRSLLLAIPIGAHAQSIVPTLVDAQAPCGFDGLHKELLRTDALYNARHLEYEENVQHFDMGSRDAGTLFIPVVVHVMETGNGLTQITDDQIRFAIRAMNERYRKVPGTAGAGSGVDTHIEFALAARDPGGSCTTGITRVNMTGNATYMANGVQRSTANGITDAQLKAYIMWDPSKYYNIYVISEIDNNNGGNGTAGYASFPGAHGTSGDGTVAVCNYVKDPASTVLTHELGHALGLYHTFEGDNNGASCPANATCATQGDEVCDTPPHIRSASNCNTGGTNACDGGSSNLLFVRNYMDYSSAACQNMLTAGQDTRVQAALTVNRASFLASNGNLSLVPPGVPTMDILASKTLLCGLGQTVQLFDWSRCIPNTYLVDPDLPGLTFAWTLTNGTETHNSGNQNPVFTLNSTGIYNATLQITHALGTYSRTENGIVVVVNSPAAACTPTSQNPSGNYGLTVYNVAFNTINSATDPIASVVYSDFACTRNTVVARGSTYQLSISITSGSAANTEVFSAYIDYNNNNVFDTGELVSTGSVTNGATTVNTNVTIPMTAVLGSLLRLRVYGEVGTFTDPERTCSVQMLVADVEDYGVYVTTNLAAVSIAAAPGSSITYGTNVTFTPTPVNGGAGPVYQWIRNNNYVSTGPTYAANNFMPGETMRCQMFSNLAGVIGSPGVSNTITMTVTGPPLTEFTSDVTRICTGGSVQFTDLSLLSPTSWSWTFAGGTPPTSSAQNPLVTYNTPGTYNVTLIASNANGTGSTMLKTGYITVYAPPATGCTVTRTEAPAGDIGITNVTLNTLNSSTAYNDAVMNNFVCSRSTTLQSNTAYNMAVSVSEFNPQWVRAYIDYNNNGVFTDAGEQIFAPATGTGQRTGSFNTPPFPPLTNTLLRMRVITDFVNTAPGPCTTPLQYGQEEEYGVVLIPPPCTPPSATATPTCANVSQYNVNVNLTSMGSATSIAIQVDNDAGGPNGYTTVQTVTGTGNYGPFGPYASNAAVNVRLVHNLNALCNLDINNVVANCGAPGALCAFSSTNSTPIIDLTTVTNTITVPSQGGQVISDLNVYVNITHTYIEDVRLNLISPTGTNIALVNTGVCGSNQNMVVEFNQQAASAIGVVCPPTNIFAIPSASLAGFNGQVIQGTWTLSIYDVFGADQGTLNSWCLIPTLTAPNVQVSPKVFLEGPYNATTGLMSDALRSASVLPNSQPYLGMGYAFMGSPGAGGALGAGVLTVTGNNAIIDYVIAEVRSTANPATIVASCAALLQRDGDVVALDGTSPVSFGVAAGNYHVAIRHRNHLGVMTLNGVALSAAPATSVDFTTLATATYGTDARKSITGAFPTQALWTGDVTFDHILKYTGANNDRDPILVTVGSTTPNNIVPNTYSTRDVNMNANVQYTGALNDRDPILVNVGSTTPNSIRLEQVP